MEALARFVFESGGVVRIDEVSRLLHEDTELAEDFWTQVAPIQKLKRAIVHFGLPAGLEWCARDPGGREHGSVIVHTLTAAQLQDCAWAAFSPRPQLIMQWVRALVAAQPRARMRSSHAALRLTTDDPEAAAFVRRRCRSLTKFVERYDPDRLLIVDDAGEFRVVGIEPSKALATSRSPRPPGIETAPLVTEPVSCDPSRGLVAHLEALGGVYRVLCQLRVLRPPASSRFASLFSKYHLRRPRPSSMPSDQDNDTASTIGSDQEDGDDDGRFPRPPIPSPPSSSPLVLMFVVDMDAEVVDPHDTKRLLCPRPVGEGVAWHQTMHPRRLLVPSSEDVDPDRR